MSKKKKSPEPVIDLCEQERELLRQEALLEKREKCMSAIVRKSIVSLEISYMPDDLISGSAEGFGIYDAVLRTQGEYKRGELLMMSGNQFVKATREGLESAKSLVILADNEEVGSDEYAEVMVYSTGRFRGSSVILPYEQEGDSHEELIKELKPILLPFKIYLD